ncbi:elongation factor TS-domain-containing protein [Chytriomyces cf. hyalinus JEL632]|nr:elongation factor TS-domain-containing protein [Chytriomyces cf. hyalinus JEL632]
MTSLLRSALRSVSQQSHLRFYSTAPKAESLAQLVARLRKETQAPIAKARQALTENHNDYTKALESLLASAAKTSLKVASRTTKEGLVAVFSSGSHAGLVEVNCETDFVQRSDGFKSAVSTIRGIVQQQRGLEVKPVPGSSLFSECSDAESLKTWSNANKVTPILVEAIAKMGENMKLRRVTLTPMKPSMSLVYGAFAHGSSDLMGRIGAVVALSISDAMNAPKEELAALARQLAQQVVGFDPIYVRDTDVKDMASLSPEELEAQILYRQQFLMGGGTVEQVLENFRTKHGVAIKVVEFSRYVCGEGIEVKESNFAEEVLQQAGLKACETLG